MTTHTIAPHLSQEQRIHMALEEPFDQELFDKIMQGATSQRSVDARLGYRDAAAMAACLIGQQMAATETEGE